jgi:hypothetical protein
MQAEAALEQKVLAVRKVLLAVLVVAEEVQPEMLLQLLLQMEQQIQVAVVVEDLIFRKHQALAQAV